MIKIMTNFPTLFQHQEVFSDTIRNAKSPVQKIFNSHIFSAWFGDDVKLHGQGPQTSSLSAAKHRFASFAKPAGRIMLHIKSFFRVLHRVASLRADAAWARKWLANITSKKLLILGACCRWSRLFDATHKILGC